MNPLPVDTVLPELCERLAKPGNVLLQAPPGAGKTTRVAMHLLNAPWLAGRRILMLEPRRMAARNAALFMSRQLGEPVGETVGYRVRMESRVSPRTRIEVLTEAILTRFLQQDPGLDGIGLVIFDEFHERHLHTDLGLALCLDAQQSLREDLRILVMSATLDTGRIAGFLDAAVVSSAGRSYPVEIAHRPYAEPMTLPLAMANTVSEALRQHDGDVLAFLPGAAEIRLTQAALAPKLDAGTQLHALYGDLSQDQQDRALQPDPAGQRKVVLASAIAESSLTIVGVRTVVDGGWSRVPRFDPRSGLTRLVTQRLSQDSATQRAGRAGREGPGQCYRLWPQGERLRAHADPEILVADLAGLALELACWGVRDPLDLRWLDAPPTGAYAQARQLLVDLDAMRTDGWVTALGRAMAGLPVHPRLAHMLLRARELGQTGLACDLAALLNERDVLRGETSRDADIGVRIRALQAFRRAGRDGARQYQAEPGACAGVVQLAGRMRQLLGEKCENDRDVDADHAVGGLLALAYPDRVARLRDGSASRYVLSSGRGARLHEYDSLAGAEWLVAAQLDAGQEEGRIFLAARTDYASLSSLLPAHITEHSRVDWDAENRAVRAVRETRLGALLIASRVLTDVDPQLRLDALVSGLQREGSAALPWSEAAREWQARILSLQAWLPEQSWPAPTDAWLMDHLSVWLAPYLYTCSRLDQVQRISLVEPLDSLLSPAQRRDLQVLAPTHIEVPSGSRLRLQYSADAQSPVLAVKLQEMFGLAETPRVAQGRMPVTLHLLSPARRPIQVTQDLRGFWDRTYAEVKKELKGRYPKHPWPDDPWQAVATARPARKKPAG